MPDTPPLLAGANKRLLFERGMPDPLSGGVFAHAHRLHQAIADRLASDPTRHGKLVTLAPFGLGTDGPFTVAQHLRGIELFTDLYEDPDYVRQLLDFIVDGTIARIRVHRRFFGFPEVSENWSFADDAIQMLSTRMVREFVLPAHRKLKAALTTAKRIGIHLCGDATRHFRLLRDELGVYSFDTGFPVDFTWLRQELGPEVEIYGGPRATLLVSATPDEVAAEARRILESGIMAGGRFVLREANDLAPGTPLPNLQAMYAAARRHGVY
jgi:uroporphyrinogen decarboxylase